ncbi:MAG: ACT domain-containing protein [Oscillospiraceae bacterium]|nr:ACT domain-containing protein [Oscillospiraceae bacterium]MBQ5711900.1 ACT domain-containing protein [Oscillospiraceae bacterium]
MSIHQISVFLENRSGQLAEVTSLLAKEHVDLRAISIAETSDYGVARMIVDDAHKASAILLEHGDILSMTPVWAVEVPDRPSGLADLLTVLAEGHVDVEYMYSLFAGKDGHAYMILRITNEAAFTQALSGTDIKLVSAADLGLK